MKTLGKLLLTSMALAAVAGILSPNAMAKMESHAHFQFHSERSNPLALPPGFAERERNGWKDVQSHLADNHGMNKQHVAIQNN